MQETKELKSVSAHDDYVLFTICGASKRAFDATVSYMQDRTPYGPEYEAAFQKAQEIEQAIKEYEALLQECVEARKRKGVE